MGENVLNRVVLVKWGMYINGVIGRKYGRFFIIVIFVDFIEFINFYGFGFGKDDFVGFGVYDREKNRNGVILLFVIIEFLNVGVCVGLVIVNLSENLYEDFNGFWVIILIYGLFMYFKYGVIRFFF